MTYTCFQGSRNRIGISSRPLGGNPKGDGSLGHPVFFFCPAPSQVYLLVTGAGYVDESAAHFAGLSPKPLPCSFEAPQAGGRYLPYEGPLGRAP